MQEIFSLYGWMVNSYVPIQQGLINSTFSIQTNKGAYILQSINHSVFKSPAAIDNNINAVSSYLQKNIPSYLFTHLVPTLNGNTLVWHEDAKTWVLAKNHPDFFEILSLKKNKK